MSADGTLNKIDELLAQLDDHWPAPCCGKWHLIGQRNPWPVTCCGTEYEINSDRRTWKG